MKNNMLIAYLLGLGTATSISVMAQVVPGDLEHPQTYHQTLRIVAPEDTPLAVQADITDARRSVLMLESRIGVLERKVAGMQKTITRLFAIKKDK